MNNAGGWLATAACAAAAAATFLLVPADEVPTSITRLVAGGDVRAIQLRGGVEVEVEARTEAPARVVRLLRDRLAPFADGPVWVRQSGSRFVAEVPGVAAERANRLGELATRRSEFAIQRVVHDHPAMRRLFQAVEEDETAARWGIAARVDMWRQEASPDPLYDYYLESPDVMASLSVDRAKEIGCYRDGMTEVAGQVECRMSGEEQLRDYLEELFRDLPDLALPDDVELGFEVVPPNPYAGDSVPLTRTYLLSPTPALEGRHIDDAEVVWNPYTNQPEVLATFTDEGGERFAALTSQSVGHKIAIVLDGKVTSAPVVQGPIHGGRTTITMGAPSPEQAQREAMETAAVLRAGAMPTELALAGTRHRSPTIGSGTLLAIRGLFALLVGLGALLVLAIGRRMARSVAADDDALPAAVAREGGRGLAQLPWLRLLVTAAAPVAVVLMSRIEMPTLDPRWLEQFGDFGTVPAFTAGLVPVFVAYVLVELACAAVPSWRPLRTGGPATRARLGPPVAAFTMLLAAGQAWLITGWLTSMNALNPELPAVQAVTMVTVMGGVFALVVLARLVDRYGLGNGFSILLLADLYVQADRAQAAIDAYAPTPMMFLAGVLAIAGIVIATMWVLKRRPPARGLPALPAPSSGAIPLFLGFWLLTLYAVLSPLALELPVSWVDYAVPSTAGSLAVHALVLAALAGGCAWWFGRPAIWRHAASGLAGAPIAADDARHSSLRAAGLSIAFLLGVTLLYYALRSRIPSLYFDLPALLIGAAVLFDLKREWRARARQPDLVAAWPLHRVALAPHVSRALADAGIEHHLRSVGHRSMLQLFGPYVPIVVMVPPRQADAARALLATALGGAPAAQEEE